jgi:hypothetical protein
MALLLMLFHVGFYQNSDAVGVKPEAAIISKLNTKTLRYNENQQVFK